MSESILSQAEIDALLRNDQASTTTADDQLSRFFQSLEYIVRDGLTDLLDQHISVTGTYVEHVEADLSTLFRQSIYIVPIEFQFGVIYFTISESDIQILAGTLHLATNKVTSVFSQEYSKLFTQYTLKALNLQQRSSLGSPIVISKERLQTFILPKGSYILRQHLEWDNSGVEVIMLLFPTVIPSLKTDGASLSPKPRKPEARVQPATSRLNHSTSRSKPGFVSSEIDVKPFEFINLDEKLEGKTQQSIDLINDVRISVVVELGSSEMTLGELMELETKDTIRLNTLAGDPSHIYINGYSIAKGEITVIDDNFGVRILEIVPKMDRIIGK